MARFSANNALAILSAVLLLGGSTVAATRKKAPSKPVQARTPTPTPAPLAPGELRLAAKSAIVLDEKSGLVLYEKNADALQYPASSTKILTALIVIEQGDLDHLVTIEAADTKVEPSALEFKPGEQYTRRHLLFALLLKSANDVAMALARDNAGSVAAFAEKMNRRAEELGAMASHFTNPHGLHNPHHFTTARDLATIARFAMRNPLFREIVATPEIGMARGNDWVVLKNHNKLLGMFPGCIGVKTGYTVPAQQVLVSAAVRDGQEALAVVMHSDKPGIWNDSKALLAHGLEALGVPAGAPAAASGGK